MTIYSLVDDRKLLVKELEMRTGFQSTYQGAPTFAYQIGPYEVGRNGRIEVNPEDADLEVLRAMHVAGLIDSSWDEDMEQLSITLPMEQQTVTSLTNWVHILYSKAEYFSKVAGSVGAFRVDDELLEAIKPVKEKNELIRVIQAQPEAYAGFAFDEEQISITGFVHSTDPEITKAYMDLVGLTNQMALTQKRVKAEKLKDENEKYSFRVWLLRLGMVGDEYWTTRKMLLKNLSGHSAFRTPDQAEAAKEKIKQRKAAENDAVTE